VRRVRRFSAVVSVKVTTISGVVTVRESGVCIQGNGAATQQTVT
jgi:hypothetical protein